MARRVRRSVLDPQQKRLYDWEHQFRTIRTGAPLTPGRLHKLVRDIARHYRIRKPRLEVVSFADKTTLAQADGECIEFDKRHKAWTPLVVAHEMAHIIQQQYRMYPNHSPHGRQFAGIMLYIMHKFGIMPAQAAMPSMSYGKVRYYDPYHCRPAGLRHWYKKKR